MHMAGRTLPGPIVRAQLPISSLRKLPRRSLALSLRTLATTQSSGEPESIDEGEVTQDEAPKKYYAPAPGNPNVILEYDVAPVDTRKKGRFDLVAVILLTLGCAFILLFFIVIVSLA